VDAVERAVMARLVGAVAAALTKGGHVSLRNERERTGYCSHKRCARTCKERRALLDEALTLLERELDAEPEQVTLFEEAS